MITVVITETNRIYEATNGLQFFIFFINVTVLFCRISLVSTSHCSSTINAAAFYY